jgi:hypothetical protein
MIARQITSTIPTALATAQLGMIATRTLNVPRASSASVSPAATALAATTGSARTAPLVRNSTTILEVIVLVVEWAILAVIQSAGATAMLFVTVTVEQPQ